MSTERVVRVRKADEGVAAATLRNGVAAIQAEMEVTPDFPPEVEEAAATAAADPRLPDLDRTDLPFVTIDPASSMDLDQALHIERNGDGYVVHYAIADLAAFVTPGDPIDVEANRRGETLYGADSTVPLHPKAISEDAGSLLPDQVRPALLWTIKVDDVGEGTDVTVERARVRSTARLDYHQAQKSIDDGDAGETLVLLKEVGELRLHREAARGGVSLPLPEQEVDDRGRSLEPGVPRAPPRRAVERADLAADRLRRRLAHGLRPGRAAAHPARAGPSRRTTPPPHRQGTGHRLARRAAVPRLHPVAGPDPTRPRRDGRRLHAPAPRQRVRRLRRRGARPSRSTPRSPPSTPT